MSIRPVRDIPSRGASQPKQSFVDREMREFLRCGMEMAVVEVDGKTPRSIESAVRNYIKAHQREFRGVKVGVRAGKVYVWREA